MTLEDFITTKPPELRLGQWFHSEYLYRLTPQDRMHNAMQWLYNIRNDGEAEMFIYGLMAQYQWKELPEYE